jgi:hypothetical protein
MQGIKPGASHPSKQLKLGSYGKSLANPEGVVNQSVIITQTLRQARRDTLPGDRKLPLRKGIEPCA